MTSTLPCLKLKARTKTKGDAAEKSLAKFLADIPDYKARVQKAIFNFQQKLDKKQKGPTRRNAHPEKDVQDACLKLMRSWGWAVEIYEAKANYDPRRGRWIQQSMKQGTVDCMGVTNEGVAVAVEFKAKGRLSTLRYNQREFLVNRIQQFAFAAVVDSPEILEKHRKHWEALRESGDLDDAREYLLSVLPGKS